MDKSLKKVFFKRWSKSIYFTRTPNDLNLIVLGQFIEEAMGFLENVLKFLKDESVESKGIQDFLIVKKSDLVIIFHDISEDIPELNIQRDTLIKILEVFQKLSAEDAEEIILSEEKGIYTITSQGKTIIIE